MNQIAGQLIAGTGKTVRGAKFDTLSVAQTTALGDKITFFGRVNGQNSVGPNITNMNRGFELGAGEALLVQSMRFVFIGCSATDINQFYQNYTNRLIVNNFQQLEGPAEYWPGGAGISGTASLSAAGGASPVEKSIEQWLNGTANPLAIVDLSDNPILITAGNTFRVESIGTSMTTAKAFFLRVYLDGQLTTPAGA